MGAARGPERETANLMMKNYDPINNLLVLRAWKLGNYNDILHGWVPPTPVEKSRRVFSAPFGRDN